MKVLISKYNKLSDKQKVSIKIDKWDTWNADKTLAMIIVPVLRQLKKTTHGAPHTDNDDVPEHLRSSSAPPLKNEWDIDDNHFARWDWILGEMIWAFDQVAKGKDPDFWIQKPLYTWNKGTSQEGLKEKRKGIRDEVAYAAYHERLKKGFFLFGKYFRCLWD